MIGIRNNSMELIERQNSLAQKARSMKHQVGSETFAAQWRNPRPTQRLHDPAVMGCRYDQLPIPTSSFEIFLGHCLEGWWPYRLFSVHDLAPQRRQILSQARATRPVRLSDLESARHRECAGVQDKQNSGRGYGRRDGTDPRAAAGRFSAIGVKPHHDKKRAWQSNPQNSRVEAFFSRAGRHGLRIWRPSCSVFRLHVMMTGSTASARPWRMKSHMAGTKIT